MGFRVCHGLEWPLPDRYIFARDADLEPGLGGVQRFERNRTWDAWDPDIELELITRELGHDGICGLAVDLEPRRVHREP